MGVDSSAHCNILLGFNHPKYWKAFNTYHIPCSTLDTGRMMMIIGSSQSCETGISTSVNVKTLRNFHDKTSSSVLIYKVPNTFDKMPWDLLEKKLYLSHWLMFIYMPGRVLFFKYHIIPTIEPQIKVLLKGYPSRYLPNATPITNTHMDYHGYPPPP